MAPTIRPRSSWTSTPHRAVPIKQAQTEIYLHYPGQPAPIGRTSLAATESRLRAYLRLHTGPSRGWRDIAYNWAVDQSGRIFELRGKRQCGGNGGTRSNRRGQAILLLVGNTETPTDDMVQSTQWLITYIRAWQPTARAIRGHRDSPDASTDCPGDVVQRMIRAGRFEPGTTPQVRPTHAGKPWRTSPRIARMSTGEVRLIQAAVGARVDGKYGDATGAAVRDFQQAVGIPADGIYGPSTEAEMSKLDRIEAIVTENQKRIGEIPRRVLDEPVDLEGAWKGQKSNLRRMRAWYAEDLRQIKHAVAANRVEVLKAITETGRKQGLTDEQVKQIADAAAQASSRVSAEDVADQLTVTTREG